MIVLLLEVVAVVVMVLEGRSILAGCWWVWIVWFSTEIKKDESCFSFFLLQTVVLFRLFDALLLELELELL